MMRRLLTVLGAIICTAGHGQIKFENGYFIDNEGHKTSCLIRNSDWNNNPKTFEYKISEGSESVKRSIEEAREFGIAEIVYRRFEVKIDRSRSQTQKLSPTKAPEFVDETLFLKLLVEGKATLYQYVDNGLERFFFSKDSTTATQLIYKEYRTNNTRAANNTYKQQLWNEVRCGDVTEKDVAKISYTKAALVKYFKGYGTCEQSPLKVYSENSERLSFNFTVRPGMVFSELSVTSPLYHQDYGKTTPFRIGLETELILPFNNKKWAFVVEPTFQQINKDVEDDYYDVKYSSIEVPMGVRRYFFLGENSKIFVNAQYMLDFPIETSVKFFGYGYTLRAKRTGSFVAGMGFKLHNKFSAEVRYQTNRQLFNGYVYLETQYSGTVVVLGYTL